VAKKFDTSDPLLSLMRRFDIPITRASYLELAYMGQVPELDAEAEANLPVELAARGRGR
jgi:hypothetical protein